MMKGGVKDYYKILGVSPDASIEEIKERYRYLAFVFHPDRFENQKHKEKAVIDFVDINEAYETLSDPIKRVAYDRSINEERNSNFQNNEAKSSYKQSQRQNSNPQSSYDRYYRTYQNHPNSRNSSSSVNNNNASQVTNSNLSSRFLLVLLVLSSCWATMYLFDIVSMLGITFFGLSLTLGLYGFKSHKHIYTFIGFSTAIIFFFYHLDNKQIATIEQIEPARSPTIKTILRYTRTPDFEKIQENKKKTETAKVNHVSSNDLNSCDYWSSITMNDIGSTKCVYGTVIKQRSDETALYLILSSEYDDFYFISYGNWYYPGVEGNCVLAYGEIRQLGQAPVMVIDNDMLKNCY